MPVRFHEFASEPEADAYALADNRLNELAEWDDEGLARVLAELSPEDAAIAGFGPDDADDGGAPEIEEVDTSALEHARFWLSVEGPLPAQPDALDALRAALEKLPGVTVDLGKV